MTWIAYLLFAEITSILTSLAIGHPKTLPSTPAEKRTFGTSLKRIIMIMMRTLDWIIKIVLNISK